MATQAKTKQNVIALTERTRQSAGIKASTKTTSIVADPPAPPLQYGNITDAPE